MSMKKLAYLQIMAAAMMMEGQRSSSFGSDYEKPLTPEEKEFIRKLKEDKVNKGRGLTKFQYGSQYIWASNQKAADKKAKKQGLI